METTTIYAGGKASTATPVFIYTEQDRWDSFSPEHPFEYLTKQESCLVKKPTLNTDVVETSDHVSAAYELLIKNLCLH